MKNTAIAFVAALAGFSSIVWATQKDEVWYAGNKLGWSRYHDTNFYGNNYDNSIGNGPIRNNQLGVGAFLGRQENHYLGFELGYDWLGRIAYKGSVNNGAFKAQGVSIAAKINYHLTDDLDIYTRLGGMVWRAYSKGVYDNGDAGRLSNRDVGISPMAAMGIERFLTKNWSTRLDYQWVNNIGNADIVGARPDNSILSIGASYRFNQDEAAVPIAPVVQTKRFTLKSDVLFAFDKATLKFEGRQTLDQLCSQLSSMDLRDSSITVLGYTDRIGTEAYNKELSQKRAHNVLNYLISKGISFNKISAYGMGKSSLTTKNICNNVKGHSAVINCLAPDRRVEIEVKGIKGVTT